MAFKRRSYTTEYKLSAVNYAMSINEKTGKENGNHKAAQMYEVGISSVNRWRNARNVLMQMETDRQSMRHRTGKCTMEDRLSRSIVGEEKQMHHNLHRIDNKVRMNHIITLSDDECSNEASKGTATVAIVNEKPLDLDILLNVTASPRSASDLHQIENLPRNSFPSKTSRTNGYQSVSTEQLRRNELITTHKNAESTLITPYRANCENRAGNVQLSNTEADGCCTSASNHGVTQIANMNTEAKNIPLCKKSQDNPEDVITLSDGADDGDVCDDDQLVLSDEYDDEDVHPTTSCSSAITPSVRRELSPNACNSRVVNLLESYVEAGYIGSYAGSANELDAEFNGYFKCTYNGCRKRLRSNISFIYHLWAHLIFPRAVHEVPVTNIEIVFGDEVESDVVNSDLHRLRSCPECLSYSDTTHEMHLHYHFVHRQGRTPLNYSVCKICECLYDAKEADGHVTYHDKYDLPYHCRKCRYRTSSRSVFLKHLHDAHSGTTWLVCPFCFTSFSASHSDRDRSEVSMKNFVSHMMEHESEAQISCSQCAAHFSENEYRLRMESHLKQHRVTNGRWKIVRKNFSGFKPVESELLYREEVSYCADCRDYHLKDGPKTCYTINCFFKTNCARALELHNLLGKCRKANEKRWPVGMHSSMKHFAESNKEEDADGKEEPSKDVEMKEELQNDSEDYFAALFQRADMMQNLDFTPSPTSDNEKSSEATSSEDSSTIEVDLRLIEDVFAQKARADSTLMNCLQRQLSGNIDQAESLIRMTSSLSDLLEMDDEFLKVE